MPKKIKLNGYTNPHALAVCGYSVADDSHTEMLAEPHERLARLIEIGAGMIDLEREEWNAICDVLNGCLDLHYEHESGFPLASIIKHELHDSKGIEKKWKVKLPTIFAKLDSYELIAIEAIGAAVRWAWKHPNDWDHSVDAWWMPEFRKYKTATG